MFHDSASGRQNLFTIAFRGYAREEVDAHLSQLEKQIEQVANDLREIKHDREHLEREVKRFQTERESLESSSRQEIVRLKAELDEVKLERDSFETVASQLRLQESQTHEILRAAQKAAESLRAEAKLEAEDMIREAENRAARSNEDARARLEELRRRYEAVRKELDSFLSQTRSLAHSFIRKVDESRP